MNPDLLSAFGALLGGTSPRTETERRIIEEEQRMRTAYLQAMFEKRACRESLQRMGAQDLCRYPVGFSQGYSSCTYNPARWEPPPLTFDQQCEADARAELEEYLGPLPDVVLFDVRFAGSEP